MAINDPRKPYSPGTTKKKKKEVVNEPRKPYSPGTTRSNVNGSIKKGSSISKSSRSFESFGNKQSVATSVPGDGVTQPSSGSRIKDVISQAVTPGAVFLSAESRGAVGGKVDPAVLIGGTGTAAGVASFGRGVASRIGAARANTAVQQSTKIGTNGLLSTEISEFGGVANKIPINSKTVKKTGDWLSKLAQFTSNPAVIVGGLMGAVGSYPFSGFIQEEALQTLGFATKSAIENGDLDSATEALELQKEMLDPDLWNQIKAGVPYVNVIDKLNDFFEAARIKVAVDEQVIADLKVQQETGETNNEMFIRVDEERRARELEQREKDAEYYAQAAKLKREAEIAARNEDAKFWDDVLARRRKEELAQRKADEDYWAEYWKAQSKLRADASPSKLNFGLL